MVPDDVGSPGKEEKYRHANEVREGHLEDEDPLWTSISSAHVLSWNAPRRHGIGDEYRNNSVVGCGTHPVGEQEGGQAVKRQNEFRVVHVAHNHLEDDHEEQDDDPDPAEQGITPRLVEKLIDLLYAGLCQLRSAESSPGTLPNPKDKLVGDICP